MNVLVADESLNEMNPGAVGELLMNGPQMSLGYWRDSERTSSAFVVPPGGRKFSTALEIASVGPPAMAPSRIWGAWACRELHAQLIH
jgi:non-ribosomal peptide synthetase component F